MSALGEKRTDYRYDPEMLSIAFLLSTSAYLPPGEPLAGQIRTAIWFDLQRNAMIGNGNWIAALWYRASDGDRNEPDLHLEELRCAEQQFGFSCSFILSRDGGVATVLNQEAPDRLHCTGQLIRDEEDGNWIVKHIPPQRSGHSLTTMRCDSAAD